MDVSIPNLCFHLCRVCPTGHTCFKHGSIVKERWLATLGANWKFCDENFRKLRSCKGRHGTKFIPNCGWGPILFAPNQIPSHWIPRSTAPSFPRVTAGNSIEASIAPDAPLSTSVFDGGNHTHCQMFPAKTSDKSKDKAQHSPPVRSTPNTSQSWEEGIQCTSWRKLKTWVNLGLRLARPCVHLRWLGMTCAHFGRDQICTQVEGTLKHS